jgi:hypothetical protein
MPQLSRRPQAQARGGKTLRWSNLDHFGTLSASPKFDRASAPMMPRQVRTILCKQDTASERASTNHSTLHQRWPLMARHSRPKACHHCHITGRLCGSRRRLSVPLDHTRKPPY